MAWTRIRGPLLTVVALITAGLIFANHLLVVLVSSDHGGETKGGQQTGTHPSVHDQDLRKRAGGSSALASCPKPPVCPRSVGCLGMGGDANSDSFTITSNIKHLNGFDPSLPPHGMAAKRNLILGMGTQNVDFSRITAFVKSARESLRSDGTEIVILTDATSTPGGQRAEVFRSLGVQEVVSKVDSSLAEKYHTNSHRWILLRNFLKSQKGKYEAVLFTDVRDVVFQSDPFDHLQGNETSLFVFREASPARRGEDGTIGTEQRNKGWVAKCYGSSGLEKIQANVVSCAGVTMGGYDASVKYVSQMVDSILSKSSCIDQGVHNYLIYSGMLQDAIAPNPLHILPLEAGIVAQVQSMPPESVVRNKVGQIVTPGGRPFAIVHQYDRSKHRFDPQIRQQYRLFGPDDVKSTLELDGKQDDNHDETATRDRGNQNHRKSSHQHRNILVF